MEAATGRMQDGSGDSAGRIDVKRERRDHWSGVGEERQPWARQQRRVNSRRVGRWVATQSPRRPNSSSTAAAREVGAHPPRAARAETGGTVIKATAGLAQNAHARDGGSSAGEGWNNRRSEKRVAGGTGTLMGVTVVGVTGGCA